MTGRYDANEPVLFANDTPVEGPSEQLSGIMMETKNMQMELLDQLNSLLYSVSGRASEKHEPEAAKYMMQDAVQMLKLTREALQTVETLRTVTGC